MLFDIIIYVTQFSFRQYVFRKIFEGFFKRRFFSRPAGISMCAAQTSKSRKYDLSFTLGSNTSKFVYEKNRRNRRFFNHSGH